MLYWRLRWQKCRKVSWEVGAIVVQVFPVLHQWDCSGFEPAAQHLCLCDTWTTGCKNNSSRITRLLPKQDRLFYQILCGWLLVMKFNLGLLNWVCICIYVEKQKTCQSKSQPSAIRAHQQMRPNRPLVTWKRESTSNRSEPFECGYLPQLIDGKIKRKRAKIALEPEIPAGKQSFTKHFLTFCIQPYNHGDCSHLCLYQPCLMRITDIIVHEKGTYFLNESFLAPEMFWIWCLTAVSALTLDSDWTLPSLQLAYMQFASGGRQVHLPRMTVIL